MNFMSTPSSEALRRALPCPHPDESAARTGHLTAAAVLLKQRADRVDSAKACGAWNVTQTRSMEESIMRVFLATLGLVVLALLAAPIWGGWEAAREFAAVESQMQAAVHGGVEFENRFERGWLCSRVVTRMRSGADELVIYHSVLHGPIPLAGIGRGVALWPPLRSLVISEWWPEGEDPTRGEPWLRARTRLEMDGSTHATFESAPREHSGAWHWAGMQGELWASAARDVIGAFRAPELQVGAAGVGIEMRELRGDIEGHSSAGMFIGRSSLSLASLRGSRDSGDFALEGLRWEQRGAEDASEASYSIEWSGAFDAFTSGAARYGPAALQLVLRRLDSPALQAALSSVSSAGGLDAQALQRLLLRSPEIALEKLEMDSPYGRLEASGRIGIDGADPRLAMGWMFAAMALEAGAEVRMPSRWLHRLLDQVAAASLVSEGVASDAERLVRSAALRTEWVREFVERGWLVREGDRYRLDVDYRDGQLLLNGRPADAESFEALQRVAL
jgi:uncharacterized protein YdgA (DUF945 family)